MCCYGLQEDEYRYALLKNYDLVTELAYLHLLCLGKKRRLSNDDDRMEVQEPHNTSTQPMDVDDVIDTSWQYYEDDAPTYDYDEEVESVHAEIEDHDEGLDFFSEDDDASTHQTPDPYQHIRVQHSGNLPIIEQKSIELHAIMNKHHISQVARTEIISFFNEWLLNERFRK